MTATRSAEEARTHLRELLSAAERGRSTILTRRGRDVAVLARRYRAHLESGRVVPLAAERAERAARIRAVYRLKPPDAVLAASALSIGAEALVTHDRDFTPLKGLRILA